MNSASAPGKVILFGEHAVVYGRPALAVPVTQVQATVEMWPSEYRGVWIEAPSIRLKAELRTLEVDHPMAITLRTLFSSLEVDPVPNLNIRILSTIPVASGLGSGAAVSVALIRAMCSYMRRSISSDEVNKIAFRMEKLYHGTPSGIDNTVITYAKPVYFVRGKPIETFKPRHAFTLIIGDTGVSAPTKEAVADLHKLWEEDRRTWEEVFSEVGMIVNDARHAIEYGKLRELGELMDRNHALLQQMTVSSPELDRLVEAARGAGALGAKLSGGGRGGNMIALADPSLPDKKLTSMQQSLLLAGARRVITTRVK
ncbi:MAG: mevalonate kinase [Anaerolineae bacterium]